MTILESIRKEMAKDGFDYFLYRDSDPHSSEYVNEYFKFRTIISGFTGSNGTLIIGVDEAWLFTDGRYFIQAQKELEGSGIKLMKMMTPGVPLITEFVKELSLKGKAGCYSLNFSYKNTKDFGVTHFDSDNHIFLNAYKNTFGVDYNNLNTDFGIIDIPISLCGESTVSKIRNVREYLKKKNCSCFISASLDDNMWLLNIRGRAIKYNPVALSFVYIDEKDCIYFYLGREEDMQRDLNVFDRLKADGVKIYHYDIFSSFLNELSINGTACFDFSSMPSEFARILISKGFEIKDDDCLVGLRKSIKNEIEIQNIKESFHKDNIILSNFLNKISNMDLSDKNEFYLEQMLDNMRLSHEECYDLSFNTISASGPNAAMMHYSASKENSSNILNNSLYLVDSGGQWIGATTDVTRTVHVGEVTYEMKHDYTRVVRGMLSLQNAVFLEGVTGVNLDILAREPMWEEGDDYKCGTGHGIGFMLNVHEGNHAIRWKSTSKDVSLRPGMLVSDEPGIYKEGKYGIRLENILLVKEKCETPDGRFLCFECLTYVPLDEDLILRDEMSYRELKWLDEYQSKC